jgi:hypothetical protein
VAKFKASSALTALFVLSFFTISSFVPTRMMFLGGFE